MSAAKKPAVAKKAAKKPAPEQGKLSSKIGSRLRKPLERKTSKQIPSNAVPSDRVDLLVKDLSPHPMLGRAGLISDLIVRETKLGNKDGKSRETHKEHAADLEESSAAFDASVKTNGIMERLKVCKDAKGKWQIVDGRHRWESAKRIGLSHVPCEIVPEEKAQEIILAAATRRHLSKGALAYLGLMMHPSTALGVQRGKKSKTVENTVLDQAQLSTKVGVSLSTMETACALFRLFDENKLAREKYEPSIFLGIDLRSVKRGATSFIETGRDEEDDEEDDDEEKKKAAKSGDIFSNYQKRLKILATSWKSWSEIKPTSRKVATRLTCETIKAAPPEIREAIIEALTEGNAQ